VAFSVRLNRATQLEVAQRLSQSPLFASAASRPHDLAPEPANEVPAPVVAESATPERIVVPAAPTPRAVAQRAAAPGFSRQLAAKLAERTASVPPHAPAGAGGGVGAPRIRVPLARS
jgi:hypothetical protein